MASGPNIQLEEMRLYVFEALRYFKLQSNHTTNSPDMKTISNLRTRVEEIIFSNHSTEFPTHGHIIDKRMNEHNRHQFLEMIHYLYNEGVLMWGNAFDSDTDTFPYFSITSYGQKVLDANELIPHDPDNYLADLRKAIPSLDPLVLLYIQESVQCFLRNNQIASSVMLGVAAEKVFYQLFEWMKKNATNPNFKSRMERLKSK